MTTTNHRDRIVELLRERYQARVQEHYDRARAQLSRMDIAAMFWASLENGYGGTELLVDPWLANVTGEQRNVFLEIIQRALWRAGLSHDVEYEIGEKIMVYPRADHLLRRVPWHGEIIIQQHVTDPTFEIIERHDDTEQKEGA